MERLKAFHWARDLLHKTVILLVNIVQVFDLKYVDEAEPPVSHEKAIHILDTGQIATTHYQ